MIEILKHLQLGWPAWIGLGGAAALAVLLLFRIMLRAKPVELPEVEEEPLVSESDPKEMERIVKEATAAEAAKFKKELIARGEVRGEEFPTPPRGFDYHKYLSTHLEPRYDSEWFLASNGFIPQHQTDFFIGPRGMTNRKMETKTQVDTNLTMGGQLGTPLAACFQWIRIIFEEYDSEADVEESIKSAVLSFEVGNAQRLVDRALSTFEPFVTEAEEEKFKALIKGGKNTLFWPRLQIRVSPIWISAVEWFCVKIDLAKPVKASGSIKVKVMLGPWFFGPPTLRGPSKGYYPEGL